MPPTRVGAEYQKGSQPEVLARSDGVRPRLKNLA